MEGYIAASILAPVPIIHLWFHGFLGLWRKRPILFYVWAFTVWVGSFFIFRYFDQTASYILTTNSNILVYSGILFKLFGSLMIIGSLYTLGFKKFFLWAALHPHSKQKSNVVERSHLFQYIPHPAYAGYLLFLIGNFIASGKLYILVVFVFLFLFIPIIAMLEEEELRSRARLHGQL